MDGTEGVRESEKLLGRSGVAEDVREYTVWVVELYCVLKEIIKDVDMNDDDIDGWTTVEDSMFDCRKDDPMMALDEDVNC